MLKYKRKYSERILVTMTPEDKRRLVEVQAKLMLERGRNVTDAEIGRMAILEFLANQEEGA